MDMIKVYLKGNRAVFVKIDHLKISKTIMEELEQNSSKEIKLDMGCDMFEVILKFCKHYVKEKTKEPNLLENTNFKTFSTDWDKLFFQDDIMNTKFEGAFETEKEKEILILSKYVRAAHILKINHLYNLICLKISESFLNQSIGQILLNLEIES